MMTATSPQRALPPTARPVRPPRSDSARWRAVQARDERYDGLFVTAVQTTGIYCRPSCPARHPARGNIRFYPDATAAEGGGFRACLRCKPREAAPWSERLARIERICRHIEGTLDERISLRSLAATAGLSPSHFQRTFLRATGVSPASYADAKRMERLKDHLRRKDGVTMAMYEVGYGSSSRLYERAPRALGMTPGTYRAGGAGATITYSIAGSPVGRVLVGVTDRGLCSVKVGTSERVLVRAFRDEFHAATIRRDQDGVGRWLRGILAEIDGRTPKIALPLDIRATAFQRRVWEELCRIPRGETRTYAEVARRIGRPRAARAVGRACATNPVAIVVPCHRVIGAAGGLTGYAYGLSVKRSLLEREGATVATVPSATRARDQRSASAPKKKNKRPRIR